MSKNTKFSRMYAELFLPNQSPLRGDSPISEISEFQMYIGKTAETRNLLSAGIVPIGFLPDGGDWYCFVKNTDGKYRRHKGSYLGIAELPTLDADYIELLIGRGWRIKQDFLLSHGINLPQTENH